MKIAVFNTLYYPNRKGGAEISVQNVCESMVKSGHEVVVYSLWDGVSEKESTHNGVKLRKVKSLNLYTVFDYDNKKPCFIVKLMWLLLDMFNLFMLVRVYFELRGGKFDVVWSNNLSGFSISVWLVSWLLNFPIVHTMRDFYLLSNNVQLYSESCGVINPTNLVSKVKIKIFRYFSKFVYKFVAISDSISDVHSLYCGEIKGRCVTIYNSVNLNPNSTIMVSENDSNLSFGYIGQISKSKGVFLLLDSFFENKYNAKLYVAGHVCDEIRNRYMSNNIVFLGYASQQDFFPLIDCLVVPSLWREPFGRVVIEAINSCKPVLVSSNGGLPELSHCFESVKVVESFDVKSLIDNMPAFDGTDLNIINESFSEWVITNKYKEIFYNAV